MRTPPTYVSVDIEADGPVPGLNSMLSFGALAFAEYGASEGEFEANLKLLPGAVANPETMDWWSKQGTAYDDTRVNAQSPEEAMLKFAEWLEALPQPIFFVGYPVCFDWMFIAYYLHRFVGRNPFGYSGLDIESFAAGRLEIGYDVAWQSGTLDPWAATTTCPHRALADAKIQATMFWQLMKDPKAKDRGQRHLKHLAESEKGDAP